MKAKIRLRLFSAVAAVIMMTVIFCMSAQSGEESSSLSGSITETVLDKTNPDFSGLDDSEKNEKIEHMSIFVRKAAHFAEYFVLCGVFTVFALTFDINRILACGLAFCAGTIYAASDEIHQLFVPGRSGLFTDVLIDSAGALVGAIFVLVICKAFEKSRKKKCGTE